MKKSFLFSPFLFFCLIGNSQTLFTYGKYAVSKEEFETAYTKNKTAETNDKAAIREYLNLYIDFKLKVRAAKDLRLDTLASLKAELENFKNQIEEIYLRDEKTVNKLIDEAFERSQKDIHLIDYFIALPKQADTLPYYNSAQEFYRQLNGQQGKNKQQNTNNIQEITTDVGFITVFTLPYQFENIIYNLKPGTVSEPVRTTEGWHLFKNAGERKAKGQIRVAQILISAPKEFQRERQEAKNLADSIYLLIKNGSDFAELAREYSHDRTTFFNEGILPAFGVGKYEKTFEEVAFGLQNNGDVSMPFETEFGYHILKRISAEPVPDSKDNESYRLELEQMVTKDDRMKTAKETFNKQAKRLTGIKENNINKKDLWLVTDSSIIGNRMITSGNVNEETVLLQFNDQSVATVGDWILYLRNSATSLMGNIISTQYPSLWEEFKHYAALKNYKKRLTEFNPEYRAQMEEFRNGNMLFEIMEKKVWNKAATDSSGLENYFQKNQQNYTWAESADALIVSAINQTIAKKVMEDLRKGKSKESILEENESLVRIDSGRYELQQIPRGYQDRISVHNFTQPVVNEHDGSIIFAQILEIHPGNKPKSFEEARGLVVSDYQHLLEQKWLKELHQQYPVKINTRTFKRLFK